MTTKNFAPIERAALCDLLLDVGPDAPTLCEGWTTRDLAAHLIVRERRPDAAMGIIVPPIAAHGESVRRRVRERPFDELVATVRQGPPVWSPIRLSLLDRLTNTNEFYIHHEDVRRAASAWDPRELDAGPNLKIERRKFERRQNRIRIIQPQMDADQRG